MFKNIKCNALKLVVCGEGGVGKTSLIETFQQGRFIHGTTMTIAVQFHIKKINLADSANDLALQIWDLGGQKQFLNMGVFKKYCTGAHAAMVCFDLSDLDTLEAIPQWINILPAQIPKILVGTKRDMGESMKELVEPYLESFNFHGYIETSAKDNIKSVYEAFMELLRDISLNKPDNSSLLVMENQIPKSV
ncbi:MAG: Rab family GTPase [Promethearchaeota archaeon]